MTRSSAYVRTTKATVWELLSTGHTKGLAEYPRLRRFCLVSE
jgi:hypothetical protein